MTPRISAQRWQVVSPQLDRALGLTGDERAAWVARLRGEDASLAAEVEVLLDDYDALRQEGFLEGRSPARPIEASLAGQAIGAYTLRSLLGQGGMGSVWLAERSDGRFQGVAAVKLLNASLVGEGGVARFRREASILARLQHPHIAHLLDAGLSPSGQPYLVLEHVEGKPIDGYCDAARLPVDARVRLFLDVLGAVAHAHAHLIVHRDLKPSNVLVTGDGRTKLLDFGIAKLLESEPATQEGTAVTRDGVSALTPEYAAPEQVTGGDVTTATDVYALGVLLYVLLTGRHPAGAHRTSPARLMRATLDAEPLRASDVVVTTPSGTGQTAAQAAAGRATTPGKLRGRLQGDLDNIVAKALKKRPQERYPSADALAEDLRRYLRHEPVIARADSLAYRTARFVRRHRPAVALATLSALSLASGLLGTVSQGRRATRQASLAQMQAARADEQARTAVEQRDFALRQLSRAEAINDLNSFLLSDAAPLGKPFTAGELLARAERIVERQRTGADDNRVEMLVELGALYAQRDEDAQARRLLTLAYELAQRVPEPSVRARAACALGNTLHRGGEIERAAKLIQEGQDALPPKPQYALHRVSCLLFSSRVARAQGDVQGGIEGARAAQDLLRRSRVSSAILELGASTELAESYRAAGRNREAASAFEETFARLVALGRDDTERAAIVLNNWGLSLGTLGRPLEAERLFRRALRLCEADGTDRSVSPVLLTNVARALRDVGRLAEAASVAERAFRRERQAGAEDPTGRLLVVRASISRQLGDLARTAALLSELERRLGRMPPAGDVSFASLVSEQALLAQARSDLHRALRAADRAVALAAADPRGVTVLPLYLLRRADLSVRMGRLTEAQADAARALAIWQDATGPGVVSSWQGLAYLVLGRAAQAQGKSDEARKAFASALQHLEPSLGTQHPATRNARQLALGSAPNRS